MHYWLLAINVPARLPEYVNILKWQNWRGIIKLLCIYETLLYLPPLSLFCLIISINIHILSKVQAVQRLCLIWVIFDEICIYIWFFLYSLRFIWNVITQITLSLSSLQFFQTPLSKWTFACMLLFQLYFMVSASNDSVVKTESHSKAVIYLFYGLWYFVLASRNSKCLVT